MIIDAPSQLARLALERRRADGAPMVIGLAGAVASGKSTLAAAVATAFSTSGLRAIVVTTDGFLLPNDELTQRGLIMRKGFPESYDDDALRTFVDEIHSGCPEVAVPQYSHVTYDVVGTEPLSLAGAAAVVVEGLNALGALAGRLDFGVYLAASEDDLERWFVTRFHELCVEAESDAASFYRRFVGMDAASIESLARETWRSINLVNLRDHIEPTRALADCVVIKGADHQIVALDLRDER